jgi:hypothetical protein
VLYRYGLQTARGVDKKLLLGLIMCFFSHRGKNVVQIPSVSAQEVDNGDELRNALRSTRLAPECKFSAPVAAEIHDKTK